jgi:hypothetical protein
MIFTTSARPRAIVLATRRSLFHLPVKSQYASSRFVLHLPAQNCRQARQVGREKRTFAGYRRNSSLDAEKANFKRASELPSCLPSHSMLLRLLGPVSDWNGQSCTREGI